VSIKKPTSKKLPSDIKPIPFRIVKKLVIEDFKKTADKFSPFAKSVYLHNLKEATTVHGLLSVMAGIMNSKTKVEAMDLLLDLIVSD